MRSTWGKNFDKRALFVYNSDFLNLLYANPQYRHYRPRRPRQDHFD